MLNLFHRHDWHKIDRQHKEENRPYGKHGFVKTIYYYTEECAGCGQKRKALYNEWIHKPENDPDPDSQWIANHAMIMNLAIAGSKYEKIEESKGTVC